MGWEQRGNRTYYYRKKREGGRVRSLYIGSGDFAQISAETDAANRQEQEQIRANDRRIRDAEAAIDRQLKDTETALFSTVDAALLAAGYHKHKGQWRKKRNGKPTTTG